MAMTETRLASVENKNFFSSFNEKNRRESFFPLSVGWKGTKSNSWFKRKDTLEHFLRHWKVFWRKKSKMAKFFVVVVASVALFGCTSHAIDLSRLYGLHNKREGNMMRKLKYLYLNLEWFISHGWINLHLRKNVMFTQVCSLQLFYCHCSLSKQSCLIRTKGGVINGIG